MRTRSLVVAGGVALALAWGCRGGPIVGVEPPPEVPGQGDAGDSGPPGGTGGPGNAGPDAGSGAPDEGPDAGTGGRGERPDAGTGQGGGAPDAGAPGDGDDPQDPDGGEEDPPPQVPTVPIDHPDDAGWLFFGVEQGGPQLVLGASLDAGGNLWVAGGA